jgi:hypothetical protein
MYEMIKGKLGVTEELPGSKQEDAPAAAAEEEAAEDAEADDSDKSEL